MEAPQMRGVEEPLLPEPRAVEGGATQSEGAIETQEARYPRLHKTAGLRSLDVWVEISNGNRYSRQQSVGEISFSRIAQPSMMAYLWTVLETRTSFIRTLQRRMDCLRSAGKTSRRWTSGSARSSRPSLSPKPGNLR